ncbi:hypothetical protein V8G54_019424, partial [Vigna mungo]
SENRGVSNFISFYQALETKVTFFSDRTNERGTSTQPATTVPTATSCRPRRRIVAPITTTTSAGTAPRSLLFFFYSPENNHPALGHDIVRYQDCRRRCWYRQGSSSHRNRHCLHRNRATARVVAATISVLAHAALNSSIFSFDMIFLILDPFFHFRPPSMAIFLLLSEIAETPTPNVV